MENTTNKCFRCRFFDRYYLKGVKAFNRTKYGWCCRKGGTIKATDGCDEYACNIKRRSEVKRQLLEYSLDELLVQLSSIREILEDDLKDEEL